MREFGFISWMARTAVAKFDVSVTGNRLPRVSRLLLLDGHSLAYRAFFALPVENFSTSTGQHTNAVYGFTSMLINVLRDEQPTHVAVAFDVSRQTFRSEEYAEYKAGRSTSPSEFKGQVSLLHEVLDALRIPYVEADGFEADDVIATLTTQATAEGMQVLICSGDRDAFQLVTDDVTVLYPVRGVSELTRMTPAAVDAKYGVLPERYSDLAALVGESSDNLPGVPGVGPKTAAKWLAQFGDLAGVVAHVDEIKGKAGDSLREHLDGVLRNRRLNQLVRDLSLPVTIAGLERQNWDREKVHTVFDSLEFRVLRDRLFEYLEAPQEEADHGFDLAGSVLSPDEVAAWLEEYAAAGHRVGVHVVGHWARGTGDVTALALATEGDAAAYVDVTELDPAGEAAIGAWLADPDRPKVLHDAKGPMLALSARGWTLLGLTTDTALAAYLGARTSAPTTSPTSCCATWGASCAPRRTTPVRACSTSAATRTPSPRTPWCARVPSSTWPGHSTGSSRPPVGARCSVTSSCRSSTCWPAWSAPASPRTWTSSPRWRRTSPPRCVRHRTTATTRSAATRSTWGRPSSSRSCSSRRWGCPRPGAPRPGTPRTPTRSPTSTPRPSTRSSRRCCGTATPRDCG
jgi:5'-3' exonuclease